MASQPRPENTDWFTLICGVLIGAIVGGTLALSFAPTWVTM